MTPDAQAELARHNPTLAPGVFDFGAYLGASEIRYLHVLELFDRHDSGPAPKLLDVGGFLGAFPLALARLGSPTTLVEQYGFYHGAFDALYAYLEREGVTVLD